ncbi:outer membrane protein assembly factor BamA [Salinibius halmophilus]|uniref:outer membrane protein assembly factor BamA n=1 Tax=Salinibius halmophilus TaxID=1853216 RepID=UPI0013145FD2|nr:outer membrane protein assembly factor BamA [Salinibius halmophilus]
MFKSVLSTAIAVSLSATAIAEVYDVESITFQGLQRVSPAAASSVVTLLPGKIDQSAVSAALRALYQTGYYDQVEVLLENGALTFVVIERPQIETLTIEGADTVPESALTSALSAEGVRAGEILNQSKIAVISGELERQYAQVGLYEAKVTIDQEPLPNNRVNVTVVVEEGPKAEVGSFNIAGNRLFSDDELAENFTLKPRRDTQVWDTLFGNHDFSLAQFRGDLRRLESFYFERGYVDFAIDSQQVDLTRDRRYMSLNLNISEGEQYFLASVNVDAPGEFDLDSLPTLVAGDVFARSQVVATQQRILDELNDQGYFFAKVDVLPAVDREALTVDLTYKVTPGPLTYVRKIEFVGNDATNDVTLRRELLQLEQSLAIVSDIRQGTSRLMRLGFLRNATVDTRPVPGTDNQIDVIYEVEEDKVGNVSASLQFSPSRGASISGSFGQKNLAGTGHETAIELSASTTRDDDGDLTFAQRKVNISYDIPYATESGISVGADLFVEEINDDVISQSNYRTNDYGIRVRAGYPTSLDSRLIWSAGLERKDLLLPTNTINVAQEVLNYADDVGSNTFDTLTLGATWRYYTLEGGFLVNKGAQHRLSATYSTPLSSSSWLKLDYTGEQYWPLFERDYWALRVHGEFGFGVPISGNQMPFYELYKSGGRGSVRVFKDNQLAPNDSQGRAFGGNLKTEIGAELLVPMPFIENKDAWRASLFIDAGNTTTSSCSGYSEASNCQSGWRIDDINVSAGIDLTWRTPVAPISFVLGYPLTNAHEEGDAGDPFSFSLGISY